ncbi:MAG: FAD-binding oxidoreductase [Pseudomonadota bacterium]|nr:FAD-binding oxidoreductase [Pseudomonadota bacterium]
MQSYYQASRNIEIDQPTLTGENEADVCVIGGGYTGLSSALYLANEGVNVVLIESNKIASGASGANGGQVSGGMRRDQFYLEKALGFDYAKVLWSIGEQAKYHAKDLIDKYQIQCDYKKGIAHPNHKQKYCEESKQYVDHMIQKYDYKDMVYLSDSEMREVTGSDTYYGGTYDEGEAHCHPLNYALGIAKAAISAGAKLYENTAAISYKVYDDHVKIKIQNGSIKADRVVLACNGYLGNLEKSLTSKILPMNNYIVATKPLDDETVQKINPRDIAFADSRFVINYFRMSADKRLLFGGGENYSQELSKNIVPIVTKPLEKIYPFLKGIKIDYAWGGKLAITMNRLPFLTTLYHDKVISAQGYSGQGVALASYSGKIVSEKITGSGETFDIMSKIPRQSFPGGRFLRNPSMKIGMLYYSLLDRL